MTTAAAANLQDTDLEGQQARMSQPAPESSDAALQNARTDEPISTVGRQQGEDAEHVQQPISGPALGTSQFAAGTEQPASARPAVPQVHRESSVTSEVRSSNIGLFNRGDQQQHFADRSQPRQQKEALSGLAGAQTSALLPSTVFDMPHASAQEQADPSPSGLINSVFFSAISGNRPASSTTTVMAPVTQTPFGPAADLNRCNEEELR